jgi:hypothetical protein
MRRPRRAAVEGMAASLTCPRAGLIPQRGQAMQDTLATVPFFRERSSFSLLRMCPLLLEIVQSVLDILTILEVRLR